MLKYRYYLLLVLFGFITSAKAEKALIYGKAESYAGKTLRIEVTANPFLGIKKSIKTFEVAADGAFRAEIDVDKTELVSIPLYTYTGFLYVQPKGQYKIKLPPFRNLSPEQKLNPFFEPEELMLGVVSDDKYELNRAVRMFDDELDRFINQNFTAVYLKKEQSAGAAFAEKLQEKYSSNPNKFLQEYIKYRLGFLYFLAFPNDFERLEKMYFSNGITAVNNPACISLYKKLYGNFLDGYLKQKNQLQLTKALEQTSPYKAVNEIMKRYPAYRDKIFRNRIIATAVYDSYARKMMNKADALSILKSVKQQSEDDYNRMLCDDFTAKITHLQKNTKAPDFNIDGKTLAGYKGKYIYLNFCNTQNYACRQDFKLMQKLQQQFGKYIRFVSIACDWDRRKYRQFMAEHHYDWDFLEVDSNNKRLLKKYGIKAFPAYILINDKGEIVKADAPSPKENIRMEFVKIAREMSKKK